MCPALLWTKNKVSLIKTWRMFALLYFPKAIKAQRKILIHSLFLLLKNSYMTKLILRHRIHKERFSKVTHQCLKHGDKLMIQLELYTFLFGKLILTDWAYANRISYSYMWYICICESRAWCILSIHCDHMSLRAGIFSRCFRKVGCRLGKLTLYWNLWFFCPFRKSGWSENWPLAK